MKQTVPHPCPTFPFAARPNGRVAFLTASFALLLVANLQAVPIRISQIIGLADGILGSVGTSEGWSGSSANFTVTNGTGSLDGTPLGLFPSAGDHVRIAATSTGNSLNTYNLFASPNQFPPSLPVNIYYSFLFRFNTLTNMGLTRSNKIVQVNRQNSGSAFHFELHAVTNAAGKIRLGVAKTNGVPEYSPNTVNVGETFFVVIRQQIIAGGGVAPSGNDVIDLWVNPPATTFGADEWSAPSPDASATLGGDDTSATGPGRFYVIAGGDGAAFDELRIATNSWADVTPSVTNCIPASLDSQPENVTVPEGISATFSVTSSSSSPLYQWQVSTNGGATWQNVTSGFGATSPTYTTPPLDIGANQNQYRCIVSVICGGGSTNISTPAILTVKPAVATPLGVVVDDRFADLNRANPPIGISNSLWFASLGSSLSDGSSGDLVGYPGVGTSRLWIGYFTDDTITNQPVHLAVGRALKVSLTFRASGIVSNGGNSMRFGVFSYADSNLGTNSRVTADGFGTGSTGNGFGVRGYMLALNFGTNFSANTPQTLFVRNAIHDINLMGSTGNYLSLGAGPAGATLNGAPAFQNDTDYTLDFIVGRSNATTTVITASITGGGTNYTTTVTDSTYAYPRFDAFAIRPEALATTANSFTFSRFLVQVVETAPPRIPLNVAAAGGNVTLTWTNPAFRLQAASAVTGPFTNVPAATSPYSVAPSEVRKFYRLIWNPSP